MCSNPMDYHVLQSILLQQPTHPTLEVLENDFSCFNLHWDIIIEFEQFPPFGLHHDSSI